jgi:hypothetical protein
MKNKTLKFMEVFIMTVAQRIRTLRLMEKMEKMNSNNNPNVEKTEDGTLKYKDNNDNVLFAVRIEKRS